MIHRIEVIDKKNSEKIFVYTIEKKFYFKQLKKIAEALTNPIIQTFSIDKSWSPKKFAFAVEVGFLPGVTDNVASTTKEIIKDLLKIKFSQNEGVYSSQVFFFHKKIAEGLINPLIQRIQIKNYVQFKKDRGMDKIAPSVTLKIKPKTDIVNLDVSDRELIKIGKMGIENSDGSRRGPLALDLTYMKTIQKYFQKQGRMPTDIELESIAQTWSEHCKHTIFADPIDDIKDGLFKTYIKGATEKIRKNKGKKDFCFSVFHDNSGAIEFDENYLITHKIETHNSPSALDPYGGAITGIVGVNRDTIGFGLGAKPVINLYGFCFAGPSIKTNLYKDQALTQKMLSPKRIMKGVVAGVNIGGNCSGIPTPQGFLYFNDRYQGKPLVFVGTVGLIPKKINNRPSYIKKAQPGDLIVMIGGRVGLDGIHGATFSSEALDTGSPATAVQIGDPITQKKLSDAIVKEARDLNLYHSITDNGAGGLSCSVAEMAKETEGCQVDLEKVPLKYPGLAPWQIWISESQERMTLAIAKNNWKKFSSLMKRRGVEATVIGKFTGSGKCLVKYHKKMVVEINMEFLHNGLPTRPMKTVKEKTGLVKTIPQKITNYTKTLEKMLSDLNICGFEFISQQYDYEVQANSVIKPLQGRGRVNGETTVTKPVLNSKKGVVISQGLYPHYSENNPYSMAAASIDTAIRNIVAAGGTIEKIALLDNFCWCSSNEPERLYQLKEAAKACYDYAVAYGTPFISGKDSMFNDFKGYDEKGHPVKISIPPTLLISSIGIIDDILKTVSIDTKFSGDLVYLLGETNGEFEYINPSKNKKNYQIFHNCVEKGLIASAISVTRGGLAVAIAKTAMSGMLGIEVELKNLDLFLETQGRIIFTINPKNKNKLEKIMKNYPCLLIGKVTGENKIVIKSTGKVLVNLPVNKALKSYKSTFKNF
jgi:phosphoribosylformylglycinamidine synthase